MSSKRFSRRLLVNKFKHSDWTMPFSIIVSTFGFFAIFAFSAYGTETSEAVTWRNPVAGSIFASICVLGIVLAMSPGRCSKTFGHQKTQEATTPLPHASNLVPGTKGHHYDCGKFSAHTIQIKGHVFCAACTGLFLGALSALFGTAIHFFAGWESQQISFVAVVIGVAATILGFLQSKFRSLVRLILNVLFVLGAFLILAGVDGLAANLSFDLFSIFLIAFWIFTRILLSQWDHRKICKGCSISCKMTEKEVRSISST